MRIVHISDTHTKHRQLTISPCDVLIFSGDLGSRTNLLELTDFLEWIKDQPAQVKLFIGGNHDICMDPVKAFSKTQGAVEKLLLQQEHRDAMEKIKLYEQWGVHYLCNSGFEYEGIKFYGSPYSPSFHRDYWVFNADRGEEIAKHWSKIPSDVNVLITHTPVYGILDLIPEKYKRYPEEDLHVGCKDLLDVICKRLYSLKLHCSGHIHSNYGVLLQNVSNKRRVLFSNGAVLDNDYKLAVAQPIVISL